MPTLALVATLAVLAQAPVPPTPVPERDATLLLEPVSGRVLVKPEGAARYAELTAPTLVANGASVDATRGRVRVTADRSRRPELHADRAQFYDGKFDLAQAGGLTTLRLTGSSFREVCKRTRGSALAAQRRGRVRSLWGDGKGRFRTSGRYSSATVRGTRWLTEDRCDGTLTRVARGIVTVEDFTTVPEPPPGDQGPISGGGEEDGGSTGGRKVRVGKGDSYVASPGG